MFPLNVFELYEMAQNFTESLAQGVNDIISTLNK